MSNPKKLGPVIETPDDLLEQIADEVRRVHGSLEPHRGIESLIAAVPDVAA